MKKKPVSPRAVVSRPLPARAVVKPAPPPAPLKARSRGTRLAAKASGVPKTVKPRPAAASAPAAAPAAAAQVRRESAGAELVAEVRALRAVVESHRLVPAGEREVPERDMDVIRRLLGDLLDRKLESVAERLAGIRAAVTVAGADVVPSLDDLLADLGVVKFEANRMDYPDPLIHQIAAERRVADAPEGVVVETLRPGFRTAKGRIVARACVAVNRRSE